MAKQADSVPKDSIPEDIAKLSFEEALDALETIVRNLERGETALEQAIDVYERGNLLRQHCARKLAEAKARIEKIEEGAGGALQTTPFDPD